MKRKQDGAIPPHAGEGSKSAVDLAAQIAAKGAGAVIDLGPGEYRLDGCIAVERDLTLRGAGADTTVVRGRSDDDWIVVAPNSTLRVTGVALLRDGPKVAADAIVVRGALWADGCRIEGATTDGDSGGAGVRAQGSGRVELSDTRVLRCGFAALVACEDTQVLVRGGSLEGGAQGAVAWGKARIELHDTCCTGYSACGIELLQEAQLSLSGCQCDGAMAAVGLSGTARASLSGNKLRSRQHGFSICGSAHVTMNGDHAEGCGDCGLFARESAHVKALRFKASDCVRWGICAMNHARIELDEPTIIRTRVRGITAQGQAHVRLNGGEVTENAMGGIHGQGRSKIEMMGTRCAKNGGPGIEAADHVVIIIKNTAFVENAGGAIEIDETVELSHEHVTFDRNEGGDIVREAPAASTKAKSGRKKTPARKRRS